MIVEDEMACCCRFEDERDRMIVSLEQRLREQSQEHLGRALLAADRTVHALQCRPQSFVSFQSLTVSHTITRQFRSGEQKDLGTDVNGCVDG